MPQDKTKPRYLPGDITHRREAMVRVNHAGEYGAKRIYQGQIDALTKQQANEQDIDDIRHMAEQEEAHLSYFDGYITSQKIRPTALHPLWHYGAYALGYGTSLLGVKGAMICTAAVEDVIDDHYQEQINILGDNDDNLTQNIKQFQLDEQEHHDIGAEYMDLDNNIGDKTLYHIVKTITQSAIYVSYRI